LKTLSTCRSASTVLWVLALFGCGTPPNTSIKAPLSARPAERNTGPIGDGSIFHAGLTEHPLFEDVRARNVGDVLIINLVENTSATQKNANDASHTGSANSNIQGLNNSLPLISSSSANKLANTVDSSGSNALSGTITATVIEVLPNGNLQVAGEKLVSINQINEYVRFSGVVMPSTIANGNTVQSTQVADAHIEYKGGDSNMDQASVLSMLSRFFQSILPF
jgi:flagellar L-ring protein precursor FlgH